VRHHPEFSSGWKEENGGERYNFLKITEKQIVVWMEEMASSCRLSIRGDHPAWRLGMRLTVPHRTKYDCYETSELWTWTNSLDKSSKLQNIPGRQEVSIGEAP
jgi:hypothetical protein